jgi:hypothetical protein
MVWLIVLRTIGWVYAAMFRPLMRTTAWVFAILWVMFGPLSIFNALVVKVSLTETTAHVVQFGLGIYLIRYLWRSSWPSRQETVRLGKSDALRPTP